MQQSGKEGRPASAASLKRRGKPATGTRSKWPGTAVVVEVPLDVVVSSVGRSVQLREHIFHALLCPVFRFAEFILGNVVVRIILRWLGAILSTKFELEMLPSIIHVNFVFLSIEKAEVVRPPLSVSASVAVLVPRHLEPVAISGSFMPLTEVNSHFGAKERGELGNVEDE